MGRNTNIKYKNKKDVNYTHCGETFYCQTKRCDKKKHNQCDECALQELNDMQ